MRFLILDTYYPAFQRHFYARHADLSQCSYAEQWRTLMDQCFGTADFYSQNLKKLGYEATEVVANCAPLQRQWAREQGVELGGMRWYERMRRKFIAWARRGQCADWFYPVLKAQVNHYRPDILLIQDMHAISPAFLHEIRPYVKLIIGQIAYPITPAADFRGYDLVLSSFPHFVDQFRGKGLASEYFNLGFETRVLKKLKKERDQYRTVLVGGLSAHHDERILLLEKIAESTSLDLWGYGVDTLNAKSPLCGLYHGEAWALDMYNIYYNSSIALNHHINIAGRFANNMRLYEVTGVGTLLLTDYKDNLHTLFELGKEVVAYSSVEECVELITYYLTHEDERKSIAMAGQQRTLREHTYHQRMEELVEIVRKYL